MSALLAPTAVLARASPRLAARPARLAPAPAAASPARRVARPAARLLTVAAAGKSEPAASSFDTAEVLATLTEKWEQTENKTSVALYAGGAVAALWASATLVSAINAVPLLPKIMELVGLGYSSWFVYRYLLFKESRKELVADVEELKAKISGSKN